MSIHREAVILVALHLAAVRFPLGEQTHEQTDMIECFNNMDCSMAREQQLHKEFADFDRPWSSNFGAVVNKLI